MASVYNNLYLDARKQLKHAGIEAAQLEAREIVCFAAGKSRDEFYRDLMLYASDQVEAKVKELVRRRLEGEPVAYLIGEWEFYGLPLSISPDVLIPRADTEVLAEQSILLARAAGAGARVLDLCAGSGCVGLAIAANSPGARVTLADLSPAALELCRSNARRNGLEERVACLQVDARLRPPPELHGLDVIACNPPLHPHRGSGRAGCLCAGLRAPHGPGRRGGRPGLLPRHRPKLEAGSQAGRLPPLRGGHGTGPRRRLAPLPQRLPGGPHRSGHPADRARGGRNPGGAWIGRPLSPHLGWKCPFYRTLYLVSYPYRRSTPAGCWNGAGRAGRKG